ncbi:MAG: DUF2330 domain-containing protein [Polyangiales bacterium]
MSPLRRFVFGTLLVGATLGAAVDARACGGCFHQPSPTSVQVVTDHRMVFAVSDRRTILWDQFAFSGRAEEFTWILPIRDGSMASVELSDPRFMQALDNLSAPRVLSAPPRPSRFCGGGGGFSFGGSASATRDSAGAAPPPSVQVLLQQTLGPYAQATIRGQDPNAIRDWLRNNGYFIPPSIDPVLDHYVSLRMDFVALRLRAGEGIGQMQPVRVSVPGAAPLLPLRMISAGAGDKVGLLLMVIAPSRMEAMGWPNGELRDGDLVYDYDAPSTDPAADFLRAFRMRNAASGERLWLTESSQVLSRFAVSNSMTSIRGTLPSTMTADDVARAFEGLGDQANLTRMRAELGMGALDRDLQLQASDLGLRDTLYTYGVLLNRPPDPLPCGYVEYQGCSTRPGSTSAWSSLVALAALAALRIRRRR